LHVNPRASKSLAIRANCIVDRLVLAGGRVRGLRLADGSTEETECITLCAGSIGSPAILIRSDIDPPRELQGSESSRSTICERVAEWLKSTTP
jgi:choline dehydrogenase